MSNTRSTRSSDKGAAQTNAASGKHNLINLTNSISSTKGDELKNKRKAKNNKNDETINDESADNNNETTEIDIEPEIIAPKKKIIKSNDAENIIKSVSLMGGKPLDATRFVRENDPKNKVKSNSRSLTLLTTEDLIAS